MKNVLTAVTVFLLVITSQVFAEGKDKMGVNAGVNFALDYSLEDTGGASAMSVGGGIDIDYDIVEFLSAGIIFSYAFGDLDLLFGGAGVKAKYAIGSFIPGLRINGGIARASVGGGSSSDPFVGFGLDVQYNITDIIAAGLNVDFDIIFSDPENVKYLTVGIGPRFAF